jgi:hypothetical protein
MAAASAMAQQSNLLILALLLLSRTVGSQGAQNDDTWCTSFGHRYLRDH